MNMNIIEKSGTGGRSTADAHPLSESPTPTMISASPSHSESRRQPAPRGTVAERSELFAGASGSGESMVHVCLTSRRSEADAKVAFERNTGARSRGRSPRASRHETTFERTRVNDVPGHL